MSSATTSLRRDVFLTAALALLMHVAAGDDDSAPVYLYNGYANAAPAYPRGKLYDRFYYNLPSMLPCVTTGDVFKSDANGGWTSVSPYRGTVGCQPPSSPTYLGMFALPPEAAALMHSECDSGAAPSTWTALRDAIPSNQEDITVVMLPPLRNSGAPSSAPLYNLRCMLRQFDVVNTLHDGPVRGFVAVRSITNTSGMGASSPLRFVSPYGGSQHEWNPRGDGQLWHGRNLTAMILNLPLNAPEVRRIQRDAYFNTQRYRDSTSDVVSPRFVTETNFAMRQVKLPLPTPAQSCLTLEIPSCLPVGGMSVWATTQHRIPSWQNRDTPNMTRTPLTRRGSIAIMVASTSTAFFHDLVPAANGAASGIVSLMAVINAVSRAYLQTLRYSDIAPQLYFFFFAAEEYGLAGSGRFVKEVATFECESYPTENTTEFGCMFPNYKFLNFTSIDLDAFDHFISIDQVGVGDDLFFHMDEAVFAASAAQQRVAAVLQSLGIRRSAVSQVPPTSLLTMLKHFNVSSRAAKSFTALTAYDTQFSDTRYQSTQDTADNANASLVLRSAQVIADLATTLVNDKLPVASSLPRAVINATFGLILWDCMAVNAHCDYFRDTFNFRPPFAEPNYYPSVFAFYQQISVQQQFIFYFAADQLKDTSGAFDNSTCPCSSWYDVCLWGKCYPFQSFLHHSFSPALDYVNSAPIYFNQTDTALGAAHEIWVESFWETDIGARITAIETNKSSGLILMCGILVVLVTALGLAVLKRVVAPKLKQL